MNQQIRKNINIYIIAFVASIILPLQGKTNQSLDAGFEDPAMEFGPRTWWHWINERVSTDGITKDLEAMKIMGYKGVHMVNLPSMGQSEVGDDVVGSDIWYEKVGFAAEECARLGMEFSFGSCPGWVAGGPWVAPEQSMQDIFWRQTFVEGPSKGSIQLPQPNKTRGWYRDVAVLAFPTLPGDAVPLASRVKRVHSEDFPGVDWTAAMDGDGESFVELPGGKPGAGPRTVIVEFTKPETVRSLQVELHEDSAARTIKVFGSDDGNSWRQLGHFHRWIMHFDPRREELVQGFPDATVNFLKLEFPIASPDPAVAMKLYELNFASARLANVYTKTARMRSTPAISTPSRQKVSEEQRIAVDQVLDLSAHLQEDGTLNYEFPEGEWTILRFGHTTNGNTIHPASDRAVGLEVDKLSKEALYHHLDSGVTKEIIERMGDLTGKTVLEMNIDSWEANCQTWTANFPEEFEARRGYDMTKWLIALTGRIVEGVDETERFLWDYRRTIGDLLADNFYEAFAEYLRPHGIQLSAEAPGIGMPIHGDYIQMLGKLAIPQGEFWLGGEPSEKFPHWPGGQDNTKEAASGGHVYGKEIISCEAFTSFAHHDGFTQYPHILKPVSDRQFCKGMNEIVFHRYVHQPDDRVPGVGLGQFGLNLERTTTWWDPGREWVTYLRRCQYMLRQGRFFADACYYYGQDVPGSAYYFHPAANLDERKKMLPVLPRGYDYDVCDYTTFATMFVEDGFVALPSGMRYRYLVLPDHARYTPEALEKVHELVVAGATVIGTRPRRSPSLKDFENADKRIQELAARIWPEGKAPAERRVGKGRVIMGKSFETILAEDQLAADFHSGDDNVWFIHRTLANGELYFVAWQEEQQKDLTLSFRVTGMVPELWNPVSGERSVMANYRDDGEVTTLQLNMDPYGSRFVLFRHPAAKPTVNKMTKDGKPVVLDGNNLRYTVWENGRYVASFSDGENAGVTVSDLPEPEVLPPGWQVRFQKNRGAPDGEVAFDKLISWTERPEEGIKYFSGTASYEKNLSIREDRLAEGRRVWLDLGQVDQLAEVAVNGEHLGVLWKPPFRIDVTDAVKPGANHLSVKVTNCWKNRILGDWKVPADQKITWTLYPFYHDDKDADLMPSGLIGPVRLLSATTVTLQPRASKRVHTESGK